VLATPDQLPIPARGEAAEIVNRVVAFGSVASPTREQRFVTWPSDE